MPNNEDFDRIGLIALIRKEFKLPWNGLHGANHWARVLHHGKHIGRIRNADPLVVELFGLLHYSCRLNDGRDAGHGSRAAEFAHTINGDYFALTSLQLDYLCFALHYHSDGEVSTNTTIQTCWDADRLDLGRVGIVPSAQYLSQEATLFIDLAYAWSTQN